MSKRNKNMNSNKASRNPENEEKKVQNVFLEREVFLNVCVAFEIALEKLKIEDLDEELNSKLLKIQNLIQSQILNYKSNSVNGPEVISGLEYTKMPESLSASMLSLCSLSSDSTMNVYGNPTYEEFLRRINCPFCLEPQTDKINLIEHMDESCKMLKDQVFPEKKHVPYSVCQILPNNTFKCNVCENSFQNSCKQNFFHNSTRFHINAYMSAIKKKSYTNFYFCSSCKMLVPDNYTQVKFHINHEIHKSGSIILSTSSYLKQGIHFVYQKSKKFKCLLCTSQNIFQAPKKILEHLESSGHKRNLNPKYKQFGKAFCEFCKESVNIFEVLMHFTSNKHQIQEKTGNAEEITEMCFFCGFTCGNLKELAAHVEAKCDVINNLRKERLKNKTPNDSKKLAVTVKTDEDCKKKENFIIVKDNTDIPELFRYFKGFGEITNLEPHQKKNTLIQYREKNSIQDILLLRDVIMINGRKLEITTEELVKPNNEEISSQSRSSSESSDYNSSDENDDSRNNDDCANLTAAKKSSNGQLQELFQRVSNHLLANTHRLDPKVEKNIIRDCCKILNVKECSLVGFVGCGLSFSIERISMYVPHDNSLPFSDVVLKLMTETCYKHLRENGDHVWENVTLCIDDYLPYINCTHKKTGSTCKITVTRSAKVLTDMLSYCLEENSVIGRFCVIIRLWLSVHHLNIKEFEYVIISLLIFFLLNEDVVMPYPNVKEIANRAFLFHKEVIKEIGVGKSAGSYKNSETLTVEQLFHKFLQFLSKFDFEKQAICLPFKHSIPKKMLSSSFLKYLETLNMDELEQAPVCILDPLLNVNLASRVEKNDLKALLETIRKTV